MPFDRKILPATRSAPDPSFFPNLMFQNLNPSQRNAQYARFEAIVFIRGKLICGMHPTVLYFNFFDGFLAEPLGRDLIPSYYDDFLCQGLRFLEHMDTLGAFDNLPGLSVLLVAQRCLLKELYERFGNQLHFHRTYVAPMTHELLKLLPPLPDYCIQCVVNLDNSAQAVSGELYRQIQAQIADSANRTTRFIEHHSIIAYAARRAGKLPPDEDDETPKDGESGINGSSNGQRTMVLQLRPALGEPEPSSDEECATGSKRKQNVMEGSSEGEGATGPPPKRQQNGKEGSSKGEGTIGPLPKPRQIGMEGSSKGAGVSGLPHKPKEIDLRKILALKRLRQQQPNEMMDLTK